MRTITSQSMHGIKDDLEDQTIRLEHEMTEMVLIVDHALGKQLAECRRRLDRMEALLSRLDAVTQGRRQPSMVVGR